MRKRRSKQIQSIILNIVRTKDILSNDLKTLTKEVRNAFNDSKENDDSLPIDKVVWYNKNVLLKAGSIKVAADGYLRIAVDPRDIADSGVLKTIFSHIEPLDILVEERDEGINDLKTICQEKIVDNETLSFISKMLHAPNFKCYEKVLWTCVASQVKKLIGTIRSKDIIAIFGTDVLEELVLSSFNDDVSISVEVAKFLEEALLNDEYLKFLLNLTMEEGSWLFRSEENWKYFREMFLTSLKKSLPEKRLAFREDIYKSLLKEKKEDRKNRLRQLLDDTRIYLYE